MGTAMILVDTSVWIEYLRDTQDPVVVELGALIDSSADLRITEPIIMELLAGANTPHREEKITQLSNGLALVPIEPALDYRAAAQLFVASQRNGHPVRSLNDCLIAAIAVRAGATLFHRDRDFVFLAEITPVKLYG